MHFAPLTKNEIADWREMLAGANAPRICIAALLFLFSALVLPLSGVPFVTGVFLVCAIVFYAVMSRSFKAVITLVIPGILLFSFSYLFFPNPFLLPAVYAALLVGPVCGAFLLTHFKTPRRSLPLLALPVGAYLIALLIVRQPLVALAALIPAVIAAVMAYCLLRCQSLTPSVIALAITAILIGIAAYLVALLVNGWPADGPIAELVRTVKSIVFSYFDQMKQLYLEEQQILEELAAQSGGALESGAFASLYEELALPTTQELREFSKQLANVLPGAIGAVALVFAFTMWRMLLRMLGSWQILPRIPARLSVITLSAVSAVLFIVSFLLQLLAGDSLVAIICLNISILLEPALALAGVTSLFAKGQGRSCLSVLLLIGLVFLFMQNWVMALTIAAFIGAFHILLARFMPPYDKGES